MGLLRHSEGIGISGQMMGSKIGARRGLIKPGCCSSTARNSGVHMQMTRVSLLINSTHSSGVGPLCFGVGDGFHIKLTSAFLFTS